MTEVQLSIEAGGDWEPGTRVQVYWDAGDGSVDFAAPLLAAPKPAWPGIGRFGTWLGHRWLGSTFLGAQPRTTGFLGAPWIHDPWLAPVERVPARVQVPRSDGLFTFAAKPVDPEGNLLAGSVTGTVVELRHEPPGALNLALSSWDSTTRVATFTFDAHTE